MRSRRFLPLALLVLVCSGIGAPHAARVARADDGTIVTMVDSNFTPGEITVAVGGTVTWNETEAGIIHTVTSRDGLWDSGVMNPGDTYSFQFTTAGDYRYYCTLHYRMFGVVHVVSP